MGFVSSNVLRTLVLQNVPVYLLQFYYYFGRKRVPEETESLRSQINSLQAFHRPFINHHISQ
jgi:hypothetical protein